MRLSGACTVYINRPFKLNLVTFDHLRSLESNLKSVVYSIGRGDKKNQTIHATNNVGRTSSNMGQLKALEPFPC